MSLSQLKRVRWAVRATLGLGILASTAANVLHAEPNLVARLIAGWPPVALFITLELISRVPVHGRTLAAGRFVATLLIAGIAAWVSYWHMAAVAARYGETGASPYLLPLSVDGLIVVASICLVELAGQIRAATPAPATEPVQPPADVPATPAPVSDHRPVARRPATGQVPLVGALPTAPPTPDNRTRRPDTRRPPDTPTGHADRTPAPDTAAAIADVRRRQPDIRQADVATQLAISERTVRRYWPATTPVNGRVPDLAGT